MNETQTATGWRPNEGDQLVGVVISLDKGWSDYKNSFYPIVTLKSDDGTVTNVHCFHAVLERRMLSLAPAIGDKLRITMQGKSRTKDGKREVTNYTVESNRKQDSGAFWEGLGGSQSAPATARSAPVETEDFTQQELSAEDEPIPF
jgi:hypothetical protein